MFYAVLGGHAHVVMWLLRSKVSPHARIGDARETPLQLALRTREQARARARDSTSDSTSECTSECTSDFTSDSTSECRRHTAVVRLLERVLAQDQQV